MPAKSLSRATTLSVVVGVEMGRDDRAVASRVRTAS
jgi:hypothetical protein